MEVGVGGGGLRLKQSFCSLIGTLKREEPVTSTFSIEHQL